MRPTARSSRNSESGADRLDDGRAGARLARHRPRPRHGARLGLDARSLRACAAAGLPILPIVVPAVASVLGWSFLLSPGPGYINALLRHLPWWSGQFEGPVDIYTVTWIVIITGLALTSFIYLFVSAGFENINAELIEAAQVSGSSRAWRLLPRHAAAAAPVAGLRDGRRPAARPRSVHRRRSCWANQNITVLTTDMFRADASRYRRSTASPRRSARRCSSSGSS